MHSNRVSQNHPSSYHEQSKIFIRRRVCIFGMLLGFLEIQLLIYSGISGDIV